MIRIASTAIMLRLAFIAGVRRGLVSQKALPEMLRTLVSLEGASARGAGDVAVHGERPLSVDLLEKLIVFLTPRRLGERPNEVRASQAYTRSTRNGHANLHACMVALCHL